MTETKTYLTQEDILAWADSLVGRPLQETANQQNCHINTIINRRRKVVEFIREKFDIDDYRLPIHALYPSWLKSVMTNLNLCDVQMTVAMGKGMGYFVDRMETEHNFGNMTSDELRDGLKSILTAPVVSETESGEDSSGVDTPE